MRLKKGNIFYTFQEPIKDLVYISKNVVIKFFASVGAILTSAKLLENTFAKKYIENSQYLHSIGLTLNEFSFILFLTFLFYILIRFQSTIINSKVEQSNALANDYLTTRIDNNAFKYNIVIRKRFKIARTCTWLTFIPLIIFLTFKFIINNDDCDSKFGKFAIKICQFSDSYEKGGDEDEITVYINNCLNQEISNDTVEIKKVLNQVKDAGTKNSTSEHYLECFNKGIFAYGYRSTGQNTFFCNLYLKNLKNYHNTVRTSHGLIVLDDPKLISLKEVYKGKYISDFILGLYYYYNKEYGKAKDKFSSLSSTILPNQVAAYSNMYLGYSKLLTNDTSGFNNIHIAAKLDPYNVYVKEINNQEKQGYGVVRNGLTRDTLINFKKTTITKLATWPTAVVAVDKMNILYIGAENSISTLVNGFPPDQVKVTLDSGSVVGSNGYYKLNVKKEGVDTLRIIAKNKDGNKRQLYKKAFRIKYVTNAKVALAGKFAGSVKIKNLKSQNVLQINTDLEDLPYNIKFKIVRFTMAIMMPRTDVIILDGYGNKLTSIMKSALDNIQPGSTIIIDNVIVTDPIGVNREIDRTVLKVN